MLPLLCEKNEIVKYSKSDSRRPYHLNSDQKKIIGYDKPIIMVSKNWSDKQAEDFILKFTDSEET